MVWALAQGAEVAWRAGEPEPDNGFRTLVGADVERVRRAENTDHRSLQGDGQMHRTRVVRDAYRCAVNERGQIRGGRFAGKIERVGSGRGDLLTTDAVTITAGEGDKETFALQANRHFSKAG